MTKGRTGFGRHGKNIGQNGNGQNGIGRKAIKTHRQVCQVQSDSFQNAGAGAEDCKKVNLAGRYLMEKRRFLWLSSIGSDRNLVDTYRVPLDI